jgi:hypothetical protein
VIIDRTLEATAVRVLALSDTLGRPKDMTERLLFTRGWIAVNYKWVTYQNKTMV